MSKHLEITIVGGGFGGVKAALEIAREKNAKVKLISDKSHFQYYPALFSTATGHTHRQSWVPLATIFEKHPNVTIINDTITSIDTSSRLLKGSSSYHYDKAILALGSVTSYFGIEGIDSFAYGIKSQKEIQRLQAHLWQKMSDGNDHEAHYVIIGAGPTGVELAGALGQYIRRLRDHFGIHKKQITIHLIEAAPRVLPRMSEQSSKRAHKRLRKLGVHVKVNKKVEKQTATELIINGKPLATQTVIWTSGVANSPFYKANEEQFSFNERGKVNVDKFMQAAPDVYVIGDNANTPYAGLAQTALHDAVFVAKHIKGHKAVYKTNQPPNVVPIGEHWAVFEWRWIRFGGKLGGVLRSAADMIGYHDILPMHGAMKQWQSQSQQELRMPDKIE